MLKDDFEGILRDFGHNVLVVKQNKQLRCSCWSEKNQETSRECPVCFGIGYVPVIEKHTTRAQIMAIPQSLPRAVEGLAMGDLISSAKAYYFKSDAGVTISDLIVEVDWSPTGKPIYNGGEISEANFIDSKRFEQGAFTYHKIYVAGEPILRDIRGIRIANVNGIKNYEVIRSESR
jgi:hypothetical protein